MAQITYLEAITGALRDAMRDDRRVFMMGEDIGHFGGPFGVTKGLIDEFGGDRIIDTPISEEGFVACCFDQSVTIGAKTHWRSGIRLPMVLRAPYGGGVRGGPYHASSPEGWFVG